MKGNGKHTHCGISGFALYVPPFRVDLERWCEWTGNDWGKIKSVVGRAFRLPGPHESVYTMAANAVLRLIQANDVDPDRVRFLALGTESSTDNSAGAVIVKGMVDDALRNAGRAPLSRYCEVPEFKHACLGGVYGMKNALRFLATDGGEHQAIVVCADKAIYERGSSGEPTQGAGAVAMLLEASPGIAAIDLTEAGTASDYRIIDFRKPLVRSADGVNCLDIPVFNGKYSTGCYIDEMQHALEDLYRRRGVTPASYLRSLAAVFMHRPYRRMPETGLGMAWLAALAAGEAADRDNLAQLCGAAGVDPSIVAAEFSGKPDVTGFAVRERIQDDMYPNASAVLRAFRRTKEYRQTIAAQMRLGQDAMQELGNIYTGALPAWVAAGLEQAQRDGIDLAGSEALMVGYGSGDAAEAIPMHVLPGWQHAAAQIGVAAALAGAIDIDRDQYLALREGRAAEGLDYRPSAEFVIDSIGGEGQPGFQDDGIEYYRYVQ